jgi:TonB family protein
MRYLILVLFVFFQNFGFSQTENDKIIFLDSLQMPASSDNYYYKKVIQNYDVEQSQYKISLYTAKDTLVQEGFSLDKENPKYFGIVNYYNSKTGKISAKYSYTDGKTIGKYELWYENGSKKEVGEYSLDEKGQNPDKRIDRFLDKNQRSLVMNGNGYYNCDSDNYQEEGMVVNGLKDGIWKGENKIQHYTFTEKYIKGIFVSGVSIDNSGKKHEYSELNEMGMIKGGFFKIQELVKRKIKYSDEAKKQKVEGQIMTLSYVNNKGVVTRVEIISGLGYGLDEQVKAIMLKYFKFKPSKYRGMPNNTTFKLPFELSAIL